ncbi:MAG: hypothetical protein H5U29_12245 [Pusillimonas sp.]|nr:hypothetical protein [Pusillimonas sp.]
MFGSALLRSLLFTVATVKLTAGFSVAFFNVVVAVAVLSAVGLMFVRPQKVSVEQERWMGPVVGALVLTKWLCRRWRCCRCLRVCGLERQFAIS